LIDNNEVLRTSQNVFDGLGKGDVVKLHISAGTDGTVLKAGGLERLQDIYQAKLDALPDLINNSNLANKADILQWVKDQPWTADWTGKGFLSDELQGTRVLELLEETIRGAGNSNATLNLLYDSANSVAGTTKDSLTERMGQAFFEVADKVASGSKVVNQGGSKEWFWKHIPIVWFSNTYRKNKEEEKVGDEQSSKSSENTPKPVDNSTTQTSEPLESKPDKNTTSTEDIKKEKGDVLEENKKDVSDTNNELVEKRVSKFSLPNVSQKLIKMDGITHNIVKVHDRPVVLVDVAGVIVPFYMTTGLGGKT
jgi:hypothetical protein